MAVRERARAAPVCTGLVVCLRGLPVLGQAVRFSLYEELMGWLPGRGFGVAFIAGAVGGAVSVVVTQPIDVVRANMQGLRAAEFTSAWHCARTIVRHQGPLRLFTVSVALLDTVPVNFCFGHLGGALCGAA